VSPAAEHKQIRFMGTICVSSAPILRCLGLTRLESAVILVPSGLGTIFAVLLVVIKWGRGRRHLLLAAEGILYFLVAGLDFASHFLSPITSSAHRFKAFDIVVGEPPRTLPATSS
jgi:hypothetical protein